MVFFRKRYLNKGYGRKSSVLAENFWVVEMYRCLLLVLLPFFIEVAFGGQYERCTKFTSALNITSVQYNFSDANLLLNVKLDFNITDMSINGTPTYINVFNMSYTSVNASIKPLWLFFNYDQPAYCYFDSQQSCQVFVGNLSQINQYISVLLTPESWSWFDTNDEGYYLIGSAIKYLDMAYTAYGYVFSQDNNVVSYSNDYDTTHIQSSYWCLEYETITTETFDDVCIAFESKTTFVFNDSYYGQFENVSLDAWYTVDLNNSWVNVTILTGLTQSYGYNSFAIQDYFGDNQGYSCSYSSQNYYNQNYFNCYFKSGPNKILILTYSVSGQYNRIPTAIQQNIWSLNGNQLKDPTHAYTYSDPCVNSVQYTNNSFTDSNNTWILNVGTWHHSFCCRSWKNRIETTSTTTTTTTTTTPTTPASTWPPCPPNEHCITPPPCWPNCNYTPPPCWPNCVPGTPGTAGYGNSTTPFILNPTGGYRTGSTAGFGPTNGTTEGSTEGYTGDYPTTQESDASSTAGATQDTGSTAPFVSTTDFVQHSTTEEDQETTTYEPTIETTVQSTTTLVPTTTIEPTTLLPTTEEPTTLEETTILPTSTSTSTSTSTTTTTTTTPTTTSAVATTSSPSLSCSEYESRTYMSNTSDFKNVYGYFRSRYVFHSTYLELHVLDYKSYEPSNYSFSYDTLNGTQYCNGPSSTPRKECLLDMSEGTEYQFTLTVPFAEDGYILVNIIHRNGVVTSPNATLEDSCVVNVAKDNFDNPNTYAITKFCCILWPGGNWPMSVSMPEPKKLIGWNKH